VGDCFVLWIFVFVWGRRFTVGFDLFHTVGDLSFRGLHSCTVGELLQRAFGYGRYSYLDVGVESSACVLH
jgi:hypothetical protein